MKELKKLLKQYRYIRKIKRGFKSIRKNWKRIFESIDAIKSAFFNKD